MLIRIGYDMVVNLCTTQPAFLRLNIHPSRSGNIKRQSEFIIEPTLDYKEFLDPFSNRCTVFRAPSGRLRVFNDGIIEDDGIPSVVNPHAKQLPVEELPPETLQFLLSSRYCEVDVMGQLAWSLFGGLPAGWARVQAICDWVHKHMRFDYQQARFTRTAREAYTEGVGVCRDYTHLALTFCRCLNIPARYVAGYLGDMGAPIPDPEPMDFSSWFEAYLEDRWYIFDPRHNCPRIGFIPIAIGRDAADVPIMTTFGQHQLEKFRVWTHEISEAELHNFPGKPINS